MAFSRYPTEAQKATANFTGLVLQGMYGMIQIRPELVHQVSGCHFLYFSSRCRSAEVVRKKSFCYPDCMTVRSAAQLPRTCCRCTAGSSLAQIAFFKMHQVNANTYCSTSTARTLRSAGSQRSSVQRTHSLRCWPPRTCRSVPHMQPTRWHICCACPPTQPPEQLQHRLRLRTLQLRLNVPLLPSESITLQQGLWPCSDRQQRLHCPPPHPTPPSLISTTSAISPTEVLMVTHAALTNHWLPAAHNSRHLK